MAARPPSRNTEEPDAIEFGIAALAARLDDDLEYPANEREILAAVDSTAIPVDGSGNTVELAEALDRLDDSEFESEAELLDRLHPVFEEFRAEMGASLMGRLRGLLPF